MPCSRPRAVHRPTPTGGASRPYVLVSFRLAGLHAGENGYLTPFPKAVDIGKAELAQPAELRFDVEQPVRRVLVLERLADRFEEGQMQALGWRGDVLEIGEDTARLEQVEDLAIERALSLVLEVVDGE